MACVWRQVWVVLKLGNWENVGLQRGKVNQRALVEDKPELQPHVQ